MEYTPCDLTDGGSIEIRRFVNRVTDLAVEHHLSKQKRRPNGSEICNRFCSTYRGFHLRMATGLYNNVRNTLECTGKS